jgi:hypothetical protein
MRCIKKCDWHTCTYNHSTNAQKIRVHSLVQKDAELHLHVAAMKQDFEFEPPLSQIKRERWVPID